MEDHLKPSLRRKPHRVIWHIGTNDLKNSNPVEVADAEIILSEITTRTDKIPDENIKTVNKLVSRYTNQNGWGIIRNDNITKHQLDERGLHLNEEGISFMVSNLVKCLSKLSFIGCTRGSSLTPYNAHSETSLLNDPM